ncbi:hypothetical protein ORV05_02035 [Amycolatopsis cynarae]|uniref:Uncharacterized protein n=1 Tax=Amycolatopsis cynarae TaxID=2995223 RepID=A0ABY7B2T4_9PSEU|nr:hypothetical protein [Amycolatopsis sp. HUAS 11-8]WAL66619.1 hypothetical protein ORV05_02035 [Amycolatopsis sp. HUAS 11-8]
MITLRFLWSWIKLTTLAGIALVIEYAVITGFWPFALAVAITGTLWVIVTLGLWHEWRAHGAGYRHEVASITSDDRRRRLW